MDDFGEDTGYIYIYIVGNIDMWEMGKMCATTCFLKGVVVSTCFGRRRGFQ